MRSENEFCGGIMSLFPSIEVIRSLLPDLGQCKTETQTDSIISKDVDQVEVSVIFGKHVVCFKCDKRFL